jgi:hypothetical protein
VLRIIRQRETGYIAVAAESKPKNGDNLNNVRCEATRTFRNKKMEYLKEQVSELESNVKDKIIRDLRRRGTNLELI